MFRVSLTQDSFKDKHDNPRKRKRNRETLSCCECRSRKISCDRARPHCSNCVRYRREQACSYSSEPAEKNGSQDSPPQVERPTKNVASPSDTTNSSVRDPVEDRIAKIERQLSTIAGSRSNSIVSSPHTTCQMGVSPNVVVDPSDNIFARGRLSMKHGRKPYYIGPTAWSISGPMDVFGENPPMFRDIMAPQRNRFAKVCSAFGNQPHDTILSVMAVSPGTALYDDLQKSLPFDDDCRILSRRFLDSVNDVFPIVLRDQFEAELETFLKDRWAVNVHWLGLFAAVVAVGYAIPVHALTDGSWNPQFERAQSLCLLAQQQTFVASASSHRSPLVTFQSLLVLVISKNLTFGWNDANNPVSGLLGLANRMVYTLGLHHDPATSRIPTTEEECELRRRVFATYLYLELEHALRTGTPLVMRATDFDTLEPSTLNNMHQVFFMRKYGLISAALSITYSQKAGASIAQVAEYLRELASAAETLRSTLDLDRRSYSNMIDTLRLTFLAVLINRLHEALLILILDNGTSSTRHQYTSDMLAPARDIVDLVMSLKDSVESFAQPESVQGWHIFIHTQTRVTLFSAIACQLVFLQRSLTDPSLNKLRGSSPDSSQIFRKIRNLLAYTRRTSTYSKIGVKEQAGFCSYLRMVEERFRLYIENGQTEFDISKEEGTPLVQAIGKAMDEELDEIEKIMRETWGDTYTEQKEEESKEIVNAAFDWSAPMDPTLLEGFDWPWQDIMLEPSWQLTANYGAT